MPSILAFYRDISWLENVLVISKKQIENAVLVIFALPMLGIILGGIYSIPAMQVTREKDPWLTLLLILGLGCTVLGMGFLTGTPFVWSATLWIVGIALLLVSRRLHGSLGHNLERFGVVHYPILFISVLLGPLADRLQSRTQREAVPNGASAAPLTPEPSSRDLESPRTSPSP